VEHSVHVGYQGFACRCQHSSFVTKFANGDGNWLSILREQPYFIKECRLSFQFALEEFG
jgi:hypothetical protein